MMVIYEDLTKLYTRAGNFYMDNEGYLVNSDGKYLVGRSDVDTIQNILK